MKEQLATFRSQLEEFARKHKVPPFLSVWNSFFFFLGACLSKLLQGLKCTYWLVYFVNLKDPEPDYNAECEYKWKHIETEQNGNGYTTTLDSWEMNPHQLWCGIFFIDVQLGSTWSDGC